MLLVDSGEGESRHRRLHAGDGADAVDQALQRERRRDPCLHEQAPIARDAVALLHGRFCIFEGEDRAPRVVAPPARAHRDEGRHRLAEGRPVDDGAVPLDDAGLFHAPHPLVHGGAGEVDRLGDLLMVHPAVRLQ